MPPRKSTDAASAGRPSIGGEDDLPARGSKKAAGTNVEDLGLPRSMVSRLAKGILPPNTQIQKDAVLAISKASTVFVNYLASNANDRALLANKKTIQPKDVFDALPELEFEGFLERCRGELERYNTIQTTKRNDYRRRVKDDQQPTDGTANQTDPDATGSAAENDTQGTSPRPQPNTNGHTSNGDQPPAAKRARTSAAGTENDTLASDDLDGDTIDDDDPADGQDGDDLDDEMEDEDIDDDEEEEDGEQEEFEDATEELPEDQEDLIDTQASPRPRPEDDDEHDGSQSD